MVNIIHGDDTTSSREYLNKLSINFQRYNAASLDLDELRQVLKGNSLFSSDQNILIENLFSKKAKDVDEVIELINKSESNIYIYDSKEIGVKNLKLFPKSDVNIFSLPKTIFNFLDGIYPNNQNIVSLFNTALDSTDLEILVFMVIRQLRLMLALTTGARIEETQRLTWQKSKLLRQADLFGLEKLKKTYSKIYEIDLNSKSGKLSMSLKESIDLFLLNL